MSLLWYHDCTDCVIWQLYKKALAWAPGFWLGKATDSLFQLSWCPPWSRTIEHTGSVSSLFILYVYVQGLLGHLTLVFLSCLCVSQVACDLVSLKPGIREAKTTAVWRRTVLLGQDATLVPYQMFHHPHDIYTGLIEHTNKEIKLKHHILDQIQFTTNHTKSDTPYTRDLKHTQMPWKQFIKTTSLWSNVVCRCLRFHGGKLHLSNACLIWSTSCWKVSWLVHTILALGVKVVYMLCLAMRKWLLSQCRYWSMCSACWMTKVLSTYLSHNWAGWKAEHMALTWNSSMKRLAVSGLMGGTHGHIMILFKMLTMKEEVRVFWGETQAR